MPAHERRADRARRLARRGLLGIGEDFRETRLRAGMTLRELSSIVGVSIAELSRIERGLAPHVAYEDLVGIGSGLALDVPLRTFPNGIPIRDAAQVELLRRLRVLVSASLRIRHEVPLGLVGDQRAWDAVIEGRTWLLPVECESRLRDLQAVCRRIALKSRDAQASVVVLVVSDTRHNRQVLREASAHLRDQFPVPAREALDCLRPGDVPRSSAIIRL
jgi:transcriptional regulator with XRE-family HTH domain